MPTLQSLPPRSSIALFSHAMSSASSWERTFWIEQSFWATAHPGLPFTHTTQTHHNNSTHPNMPFAFCIDSKQHSGERHLSLVRGELDVQLYRLCHLCVRGHFSGLDPAHYPRDHGHCPRALLRKVLRCGGPCSGPDHRHGLLLARIHHPGHLQGLFAVRPGPDLVWYWVNGSADHDANLDGR